MRFEKPRSRNLQVFLDLFGNGEAAQRAFSIMPFQRYKHPSHSTSTPYSETISWANSADVPFRFPSQGHYPRRISIFRAVRGRGNFTAQKIQHGFESSRRNLFDGSSRDKNWIGEDFQVAGFGTYTILRIGKKAESANGCLVWKKVRLDKTLNFCCLKQFSALDKFRGNHIQSKLLLASLTLPQQQQIHKHLAPLSHQTL